MPFLDSSAPGLGPSVLQHTDLPLKGRAPTWLPGDGHQHRLAAEGQGAGKL